jgi:hypothetical protein
MQNRSFPTIAVLLIWVLCSCSSLKTETLVDVLSPGGRFSAEISVNRGSALKSDWYGVSVRKTNPSWSETILRRRSIWICTLQGPGKIAVSWTGPNALLVTCTGCSRRDLYINEQKTDGVSATFEFPTGADVPDT